MNWIPILEVLAERRWMLDSWAIWATRIIEACLHVLGPQFKVFITGDVIEGRKWGGGLVEVIIALRETPQGELELSRIKSLIEKGARLPPYHPFKILVVSESNLDEYLGARKRVEVIPLKFKGTAL
ncbi:MAG: hypothetical protein DRJ51_03130 [Thermoprotei archaeon]|nr:MAG: hypothetical protein DRJ51_03130 [Thermoprotei archaeon]RLF02731.1 MAG: hypothetical protein DRJ59_02810 [Thermoprotei archaeon]